MGAERRFRSATAKDADFLLDILVEAVNWTRAGAEPVETCGAADARRPWVGDSILSVEGRFR